MKITKSQLSRILRESIDSLPFESTENFVITVQPEGTVYIEHSDEGLRELFEIRAEHLSELIAALQNIQSKV